MTDARILTTLPSHPKTKRLIRRLGGDGAWRLVCLFLWARGNRPDGDLAGLTDEDIELATDWNGAPGALIAALIECGFIDGAEGSRSIHDWAEHQPWSLGSSRRSEAAKSNAAKKWGIELAAINGAKRSERLAAARRIATHTQEEWTALLSALGGRCLACGAESDICKDHINPLYLGGSDGIDNLQPLCRSCNSKKCGPGREIDYRPADWAERLRIALLSVGMLAERLPNACKTPADSEKTPAPSPSPSPSPSPLPKEPVPDQPKPPAEPLKLTPPDDEPEAPDSTATRSRRSPIELQTWLNSLAADEDPIHADDPIMAYADDAGIEFDWLLLAWDRFRQDMIERRTKKRDWRAHFRNAVRNNWYRLWWARDGGTGLTTVGEQAMMVWRNQK